MTQSWIDICGKNAAILAAVEVGLGSLLHTFRIPFSGQFLSLNEGAVLTRASLQAKGMKHSRWIAFYTANVAAILKSLSPSGKKLTPMLAISAQGGLFSLGTLLFGINPVGVCVGMGLLSFWAFAQPMLIYYLLYGKTLITVADYFFEKLSRTVPMEWDDLFWVLSAFIAVKFVLAIGIGLAAYYLPTEAIHSYQTKLILAGSQRRRKLQIGTPTRSTVRENIRLAFGDLMNPLFIVSLLLTAVFFFFVDAPFTQTFWALLRPLAVGFLLFFAIRATPFERLYRGLETLGFQGFGRSLQSAIKTLKQI